MEKKASRRCNLCDNMISYSPSDWTRFVRFCWTCKKTKVPSISEVPEPVVLNPQFEMKAGCRRVLTQEVKE